MTVVAFHELGRVKLQNDKEAEKAQLMCRNVFCWNKVSYEYLKGTVGRQPCCSMAWN